jgi:hypothetical protein
MPNRTPIDPTALCRCGHSRAQHQNITGKRQCLDCHCECFKLPGQNTWPCGCLKTDHPYSESTDACFKKFVARATRKMRPDDVCTCSHTRQQHLLVAPTGCGRCHCTTFVLDLEATVAALGERSNAAMRKLAAQPNGPQQTSLYDVCTCGRPRLEHPNNCDCNTFVLAKRDPKLVCEAERCRVCQGPAQYEVRIELLMLYDFPLTNFSWYLCDNCMENGMMLKFQRDRRVFRRTKPCDA